MNSDLNEITKRINFSNMMISFMHTSKFSFKAHLNLIYIPKMHCNLRFSTKARGSPRFLSQSPALLCLDGYAFVSLNNKIVMQMQTSTQTDDISYFPPSGQSTIVLSKYKDLLCKKESKELVHL